MRIDPLAAASAAALNDLRQCSEKKVELSGKRLRSTLPFPERFSILLIQIALERFFPLQSSGTVGVTSVAEPSKRPV